MYACSSAHSLQMKASKALSVNWRYNRARRPVYVNRTASTAQAQTSGVVGSQTSGAALSWQQLAYAAIAAQHTSLCYANWDNLEDVLTHKKLQLLGCGSNYYTRWFVADGCIDVSTLVESALRGSPSSGAPTDDRQLKALLQQLEVQPPVQQRFIHLRGVAWSAADTDSRRVWRQLGRVWPRPFLPQLLHPAGIVVAHDGVGGLGEELYAELEQYISSSPHPLAFVGHSLGGALGKLLMVQARVKQRIPPHRLSSISFGSPPVLAHRDGGGGTRVLQLLGIDKSRCLNFVHENDPVPRALLSADPAYRALLSLSPVRGMLELRQRLFGRGSVLSPDRFLFEPMGDVVLLKSDPEGGQAVSLLDEADSAQLHLELSLRRLLLQPLQAASLWLDHHYVAYSQELQVAALLGLQQQARALGLVL